jgi:exonuclease SbcC
VKLHRLKLINFRQHQDTEIVFGDGVTGIIGPNGSGKTTLLEAISWAMYGPAAVRGDKDGVRNLRAKARSSVRVELEFGLGRHEFRVVRGLHSAELYQDGQPLANSIREVTDKVERLLGMRHDEFFNTYFTGQKELTVMARLGPTERAAFLSRVLGYDVLKTAQDRLREQRNAIAAEVKGLEAGLPDRAALEAERKAAAEHVAEARRAARAAEADRKTARAALDRDEPAWEAWVARRERVRSLDGERRIALQAIENARQEFSRLDRELTEAVRAREELRQRASELEPIANLKKELAVLERKQREAVARQGEEAQVAELRRAAEARERRLNELVAGAALEAAEADVVAAGKLRDEADRAAEQRRTEWVRSRQDAETKRAELRRQYDDVKEQQDRIKQLGPEGQCPTCKRPLGKEHAAEVLGMLENQLDSIKADGKFFKQLYEQLEAAPAPVVEAEAARAAALAALEHATARAGELRAQMEERARLDAEAARDAKRIAEITKRLAARPSGYDATRHDAVRTELARLEPVALEAAALTARAQRAEVLVGEAELAEKELSRREEGAQQIAAALTAEGFSEAEYNKARERHERASLALRAAELAVAETRGELTAAEQAGREAERRERERAAREDQVAGLKTRLRLHSELDRAYSDRRAELNAAMRPEIAELASGFLADLTDGRDEGLDLDENYQLIVLEDEKPKPVLSGGEEDVANLVLRLAISQLIAERAGQPLSLLVLDEVFGSLDESRRQHVLGLLRRLGDRFPQVVLITHIEQVRDGLDRVIRVEYDAGRGTSVVRDDTATLGVPDAGVAA